MDIERTIGVANDSSRDGCGHHRGDQRETRPAGADGESRRSMGFLIGPNHDLCQYLIMNLGISENFGTVDYDNLKFPSTMRVDWIRVYQDPDLINIGCDPSDFPTAAYIAECVRVLRMCANHLD